MEPARAGDERAVGRSLKGRYTGDFGGVYLHRGLSLMECLTPWLVAQLIEGGVHYGHFA